MSRNFILRRSKKKIKKMCCLIDLVGSNIDKICECGGDCMFPCTYKVGLGRSDSDAISGIHTLCCTPALLFDAVNICFCCVPACFIKCCCPFMIENE